jgi:hypothetical protein
VTNRPFNPGLGTRVLILRFVPEFPPPMVFSDYCMFGSPLCLTLEKLIGEASRPHRRGLRNTSLNAKIVRSTLNGGNTIVRTTRSTANA